MAWSLVKQKGKFTFIFTFSYDYHQLFLLPFLHLGKNGAWSAQWYNAGLWAA
jgi:hypothetical protein